jgi:hypothetical protein
VQSEDDDFHEFDPYAALVDLSDLLATLSLSYNQLIEDYMNTKHRLRTLEISVSKLTQQIKDLQ